PQGRGPSQREKPPPPEAAPERAQGMRRKPPPHRPAWEAIADLSWRLQRQMDVGHKVRWRDVLRVVEIGLEYGIVIGLVTGLRQPYAEQPAIGALHVRIGSTIAQSRVETSAQDSLFQRQSERQRFCDRGAGSRGK